MRRRAAFQHDIRDRLWQRAARQQAARDGNDAAPPELDDFGFHHPYAFVEMAAQMLEVSNWVSWPESGGWTDQDSFLVRDVLTYFDLQARIEYEVEQGVPAPDDPRREGVIAPDDELVIKKLG